MAPLLFKNGFVSQVADSIRLRFPGIRIELPSNVIMLGADRMNQTHDNSIPSREVIDLMVEHVIGDAIRTEQDRIIDYHNARFAGPMFLLLSERPTWGQIYPDSILYIAPESSPANFLYLFVINDRHSVLQRMGRPVKTMEHA